jgi:hypothetical protein
MALMALINSIDAERYGRMPHGTPAPHIRAADLTKTYLKNVTGGSGDATIIVNKPSSTWVNSTDVRDAVIALSPASAPCLPQCSLATLGCLPKLFETAWPLSAM